MSRITSPTYSTQRVTKHPKYYIHSGDLHLLIRGQLFRVHSYFFDRDSTKFLPVPNCAHLPNRGDSDESPVVVDVDPAKFEKLLWVFYNPTYSLYDALVEDWADILELSHEWSFTQAKRLAIRELEKLEMVTVERITLYEKNQVPCEFLVPLYAELVTRTEMLSVDEAQAIGLPAVIVVCRLREQLRNPTPSPPPTPMPSTPVNFNQRDIWRRVAEAFGYPVEAANGPGPGTNSPRTTTAQWNGRTGGRANRYVRS